MATLLLVLLPFLMASFVDKVVARELVDPEPSKFNYSPITLKFKTGFVHAGRSLFKQIESTLILMCV